MKREFILKILKLHSKYILGMVIVAISWALLSNLQPYLVKRILDVVIKSDKHVILQEVMPLIIALFGSSLLYVLLFRFYDWVATVKLSPLLKSHTRLALTEIVFNYPHSFFQNNFSGSVINKINDVADGIANIIPIVTDRFVASTLLLLFSLVTVSTVSLKYTIGLFIWTIVFLIGSCFVAYKSRSLTEDAAEARARVSGYLGDVLSNMINIRLFHTKSFEYGVLKENLKNYVSKEQTRDLFFLKMHAYQGSTFVLFQGLCLYWLVQGLINKTVTPGDFTLILTINLYIVDVFWDLAKDFRTFWEKRGDISQGLSLLLCNQQIENKSQGMPLKVERGEIIFENVEFGYPNTRLLFHNKFLVIPPGSNVGLVGYSGSGKSTFVHLILRLFEINAGRILIDKQDITKVTHDSLRTAIGMIPQEPYLFHRSIMENIRYGKLNASDNEVIQAAKKAHAHEFIANLEDGYNTIVGERGLKLSGGQRQLIAIARAILKNSPILILDEATSQLDAITESYIQETILDVMQDKTTLVIAHRLSTLLYMDRILVFDKGAIVEDGTHDELLAQGGLYSRLWEMQIGGLLPENSEIMLDEVEG